MSDLSGLIKKEFGRIRADRRSLFLIFFIPAILIIIFGLTTGGGPQKFFNVSIISKDAITWSGDITNNTNSTDSEYGDLFIDIV